MQGTEDICKKKGEQGTANKGSPPEGGVSRRQWPPAARVETLSQEYERIFGHPEQFGSARKRDNGVWEVTILRHPTRMTREEKAYALECVQTVPPALHKHGFCPVNSPTMVRCPIGGGTCLHSILNSKALKNAVQTHYNLHHRSVPQNSFEIKVENNRGGYTYITYPTANLPMGGSGTGVSLSTANPVGINDATEKSRAHAIEAGDREGNVIGATETPTAEGETYEDKGSKNEAQKRVVRRGCRVRSNRLAEG